MRWLKYLEAFLWPASPWVLHLNRVSGIVRRASIREELLHFRGASRQRRGRTVASLNWRPSEQYSTKVAVRSAQRRFVYQDETMYRTTMMIAILFSLTGAPVVLHGQDLQAAHPSPEDAFSTRELIAWTYLQTPQPAPKPLPPPDVQTPGADQSRASTEPQLFVGKIVKDSGTYVLQVANVIYRLEGQIDSRAENQVVKVLGAQSNRGTIRVLRIERLS
jgi:hypothetical protein